MPLLKSSTNFSFTHIICFLVCSRLVYGVAAAAEIYSIQEITVGATFFSDNMVAAAILNYHFGGIFAAF